MSGSITEPTMTTVELVSSTYAALPLQPVVTGTIEDDNTLESEMTGSDELIPEMTGGIDLVPVMISAEEQ